MKYLIFFLLILSCKYVSAQDSTDIETDKWKASLPFCDSTKKWYYRWSYNYPDYSSHGWGENYICQWNKPTNKQVLSEVKKILNPKKFKYVKVDTIFETFQDWGCPCQQRKKAF